MIDPITVPDDMYELGLVPLCPGWIGRSENKRRRCGLETIGNGVYCAAHGGDQLGMLRTVQKQRKILEEELLPKATERILRILVNPEAKDSDVIRVWATIMDRVGLAAMQSLTVEVGVQSVAPIDMLRELLMGRVIEGDSGGSSEVLMIEG